MTRDLSVRDWCGLATGIVWGLVLGPFFKSGDMTGPWMTILLGPPVVFLVSPARPILSWQVPIITAVVSGTLMSRDPKDPGDIKSEFAVALLTWVMCSVLASPWALVFQRRVERIREETNSKVGATVSYIGVGLLVFLSCALVILGIALTLYPIDSTDPGDASLPLEGFLLATLGIGVVVTSYRFAAMLGASKPVRAVLELVLGLGSIFGVLVLTEVGVLSLLKQAELPRLLLPGGGIWFTLVTMEILVTLLWLVATAKRAS